MARNEQYPVLLDETNSSRACAKARAGAGLEVDDDLALERARTEDTLAEGDRSNRGRGAHARTGAGGAAPSLDQVELSGSRTPI